MHTPVMAKGSRFLAVSLMVAAGALARPLEGGADKQPAESGIPFKVNSQRVEPITVNKVIPIIVGGGTFTFTPNLVTADPGDILQFQFAAGTHSVTQSTADNPCQPMLDTPQASLQINSGFMNFSGRSEDIDTFNVPVRDTSSLFFYSARNRDCQQGMIMAVNAETGDLINYANQAARQNVNVQGRAVSGGILSILPISQAAFLPANSTS